VAEDLAERLDVLLSCIDNIQPAIPAAAEAQRVLNDTTSSTATGPDSLFAWEAAAAGQACQHRAQCQTASSTASSTTFDGPDGSCSCGASRPPPLTASHLFSASYQLAMALLPLAGGLADTEHPSIAGELSDAIPILQAAADSPGSFAQHPVLSNTTLPGHEWQRVSSRAQQRAAAGRRRYAARALAGLTTQAR
jgi:hypothetical protein